MYRSNLLESIQAAGRVLIALILAFFVIGPYRANSADICFSEKDAGNVAVRLEQCRDLESGLAKCTEAAAASQDAIDYCESLRKDLAERIETLTKERDEALRMASESAKAGREAANLPWYSRAWSAGKWFLAGGAAVSIGVAVFGR